MYLYQNVGLHVPNENEIQIYLKYLWEKIQMSDKNHVSV